MGHLQGKSRHERPDDDTDQDGHGPAHRHGPRDSHGNPEDLQAYLAKLLSPDRDDWQKPDRVVRALRLRPGAVVYELGTGPGYFTDRLAAAVGPTGRVYAVDVEPEMIRILRRRIRTEGWRNVTAVLARDGTSLPPCPCDLVLVVNTFHHFPEGTAYLSALAGRLRPGGRIVNIDFQKRRTPPVDGPPIAHRVARGRFLAMARRAGLQLVREHRFLPCQYFLELQPRPAARTAP